MVIKQIATESRRYRAFHKEQIMQMFIANPHGQEALNARAAALGLKAGTIQIGASRETIHALGGNTFAVKEVLKAAGARWNGAAKVWAFENREALEAALAAVEAAQ